MAPVYKLAKREPMTSPIKNTENIGSTIEDIGGGKDRL